MQNATKRTVCARLDLRRLLLICGLLAVCPGAARAAEMDGVTMPDFREVGGAMLRLNGMGVRTYSMFHVHIYVAGLYLERPTSDPEAILNGNGPKLLDIHFVHDVSEGNARKAWSDGFADNCVAPCHLEPNDVARFLAQVPAFRRGDHSTLEFGPHGVTVTINGRSLGTIDNPTFARAMLATFIGPVPPTEPLKHGLLGLR